ncbi:glycosyltransferase family 9 protein [Thiohalophilus sp.]|uniref:glycosyltransferase family 9 protein n=1 Tax=Thiohalophilus sp. TaxID=3028392 RepID=UPI002ACDDBD5|nr:glycosyltransferase family 9 protein [Thiohalophilus sp.]MDZ7805383.1 glycosyltransferase family 9 protein [Thiohalophilus sp.]
MQNSLPRKILVVRNDKLGDFMLSLPVFWLLKQNLPDCELHALVPGYTHDIGAACDAIDKLIVDPGKGAGVRQQSHLLRAIRAEHYDTVITLFSTSRIGLLLWLAGIRYRLAPATKLAQIFYNHRLVQRRSRSEKPEYQYNLDLADYYLDAHRIPIAHRPQAPYLDFEPEQVAKLKQAFLAGEGIAGDPELIIVHPGSGGSANNLSVEQYARLLRRLPLTPNRHIVITAGPGEESMAESLASQLGELPHSIYYSRQGLVNFARFLQNAALFISGSTGPLHIAGALDRPTAAFYPRKRSSTALRWQTLSSENRRLGFMPPEQAETEDMQRIDIEAAAKQISDKLL